MVRKIVLTHNLGDQLVGQFAETDGLGTDATLSAAIAGNDPFTEINRGISGLYLHSDGHTFAEGEKLTFKLVSEGLDEPDIRERTIAFVDNAPRVDNPFGDPIHTSLTGTVTFGNDSVEGEVAFVPEE